MIRLHPFQHGFADLAELRFEEIREEAQGERRDLRDRAQFVALSSVQRLLTDMESPELIAAHPEAAGEYVTALYVTYRYWEAGCNTVVLSRDRLEAAFTAPPPTERPIIPHGACYLQLPERWFWAQIDPDEAHEPLDGMFVVQGALARDVSILAVLGLRAARPGFSQIALTVVPEDLRSRPNEGPNFASRLDGGDAAGLKSVTTPADLLHLTAIALHDVGETE